MNYIPKIAEMLGIEIGEEFHAVYEFNYDYLIKFTGEDFVFAESYKHYDALDSVICDVLSGDAKIVKEPWKPQKYKPYWFYEECGVYKDVFDDNKDYKNWKIGNCFRTKVEAEIKGKELMEQIRKEYEEA